VITISNNLKTHLGKAALTVCQLLKITWADGVTVKAFARHDSDVTVGGVTFAATNIDDFSDIASACDLSVDNGQVTGVLTSPSITEPDLRAGLWDFARFELSLVNWASIADGVVILRSGQIGRVSAKRNTFTAEHRSKLQYYSMTLGELTQPGCRNEFGDGRCTFDRASLAVTGTVGTITNDGLTITDSARTEAGPASGIAITGVSNSNPCHITVASGTTLSNGEGVMLSGIVGPAQLNTSAIIRNLSGNVFDIGVDTSDTSVYPPYVSGGTVTPLGGASGYFDFGLMTMTSGAASGFAREVRAYVPGQWTLELPFPYALAVGDAYSMTPGCDKAFDTCKNRYNNVTHFQGEPDLPGIDKVGEVGTQST
jgi:hypothetical protein